MGLLPLWTPKYIPAWTLQLIQTNAEIASLSGAVTIQTFPPVPIPFPVGCLGKDYRVQNYSTSVLNRENKMNPSVKLLHE